MATSIKDFVGVWTVRWIAGENPWLEEGWTIALGTGSETMGDIAPFLDSNFQTCVGFAVLDGETIVLSSAEQDEYHQPLVLLFSDGTLRWSGFYEGQALRLYISFSATESTEGETYASLYGSTTYGDPDQVAVWGADGVGN
ncbi:MAG TPA: hypothetical protein VN851_12215 [Thermoanaerobaculia bacterium]|nr:hypothetical protein [Thermoanaerobaculia bacterium]